MSSPVSGRAVTSPYGRAVAAALVCCSLTMHGTVGAEDKGSNEFALMVSLFGEPRDEAAPFGGGGVAVLGGVRNYDRALVPALAHFLESDDDKVVLHAARLSSTHYDSQVALALKPLINHNCAPVRVEAARTLTAWKAVDDEVADRAIAQLQSETDTAAQLALIEVVGTYRGGQIDVFAHLVRILQSDRCKTDDAKIRVLKGLRNVKKSDKPQVCQEAAETLARQFLDSDGAAISADVRYYAALAAGDVAVPSASVVEGLQNCLTDARPIEVSIHSRDGSMRLLLGGMSRYTSVAGAAARALGKLGTASRESLPTLRKMVHDDALSLYDHVQVAGAIALIDKESTQTIPVLARALRYPEPEEDMHHSRRDKVNEDIVLAAARLLARIGPRGRSAESRLDSLVRMYNRRRHDKPAYGALRRNLADALDAVRAEGRVEQ